MTKIKHVVLLFLCTYRKTIARTARTCATEFVRRVTCRGISRSIKRPNFHQTTPSPAPTTPANDSVISLFSRKGPVRVGFISSSLHMCKLTKSSFYTVHRSVELSFSVVAVIIIIIGGGGARGRL